MKLTFEADTFGALLVELQNFVADAAGETTITAPKASKPKKAKAAKPVEVKEEPAPEPEETTPEPAEDDDDEMTVEDMREAMRQDMMTIYTNPDGKKFVEDQLVTYKLKNFSELSEDKVAEVFNAVREFKQSLAA